ncbi:response regulator [bacterium]|nr:response regulator [bacterium]
MQINEADNRILLVDDDEMVLTSLTTLLELETAYQLTTARSGDEALAAAESTEFDVVVSDYLMPGMNGIELLAHFKERQPWAPRVLLTGYADKENAIRAINEVGLFQYLEKPWDNAHLLLVIRNALERRHLVRALRDKIAEADAAAGKLDTLQQDILRAFI